MSRAFRLSVLVLLAAVAMRFASAPTANVSYLILGAYALLGRIQAIQALALSWLFNMLSPGVAPEAVVVIGRYAVLAGAALSVLLRSGIHRRETKASRVVMATMLLGVFFACHALFFSSRVEVSMLKAMMWAVTMATLLSAWGGILHTERDLLAKQLFGALVVVLLFSLPLLASPLGYIRNNIGFQGILNHPQVFGPTMGLLGAWAAGKVLGMQRPSWYLFVLVAACVVLIIVSEARTGGLALLFGVAASVALAIFMSGRSMRDIIPSLASSRSYVLLFGVLVGIVAVGSVVDERLDRYVSKRTDVQGVFQAYDVARGRMIDEMFENIKQHPLTGIGFGVASEASAMIVRRDPLLGLPVGASVEKGVLPLAVLEEVGLPGAALFALWILMLVRRTARRADMAALAVMSTALLLNLGEATLFSPGGMGLLSMILLAWAVTAKPGPGGVYEEA